MTAHTFTSRDFSRGLSSVKRAAAQGPVFMTDRGRPAYALLKIDDYERLLGARATSLLDVMDQIAGGDGVDFDPPRLEIDTRAAELD